MVNFETIHIRIAECKACINDEYGNFDELMWRVLVDMLRVKGLQSGSSSLPYVQLEKSVWCDLFCCTLDAVFAGEDGVIRILASSSGGVKTYWRLPWQIPREAMLEVMLQLECQLKRAGRSVQKRFR